jgi:integrase
MPRIPITDEYALVKRKGSLNWYLEWRERGEKLRRSTGTQSVDAARVNARAIILGTATIRDQRPADMPVIAVVDRYMEQHGKNLARRSANKRAAKLWALFWGADNIADMTIMRLDEFTAWLYARGYSQGYVRATLAVGKAALNRAWQRQEITSAPFVRLPEPGEAFSHLAKHAQLAAFLNAIPEGSHLWAYALIRLNTACRGDAALELQPFQVNFDDGLIALNPTGRRQTKKRRPVVRLTSTLRAVLNGLKPEATYVHWFGRKVASIRTSWNEIRDATGLPAWFSPKVLRHTVATELRRRGVPGWEVSGLLGHKAGDDSHPTTAIYAKYDPSYLGKATRAIDAFMRDLAKDVPALRGVSAGSVTRQRKTARTPKSRAASVFRVVEPAGLEPATSTMPSLHDPNEINAQRLRIVAERGTTKQGVAETAGSVRGQTAKPRRSAL